MSCLRYKYLAEVINCMSCYCFFAAISVNMMLTNYSEWGRGDERGGGGGVLKSYAIYGIGRHF